MARPSSKRSVPLGARPWAVWAVKRVVSPLDRRLIRWSRGRLRPLSTLFVPTLLLTTKGRQSGIERTIPLVYLRDGAGWIVANARPKGERRNPWVLNLRAARTATVRIGRQRVSVTARELTDGEIAAVWPSLVEVWPAFAAHYAATGERAAFRLARMDAADGLPTSVSPGPREGPG